MTRLARIAAVLLLAPSAAAPRATSASATAPASAPAGGKSITSEALKIEIRYPRTWKAVEVPSDRDGPEQWTGVGFKGIDAASTVLALLMNDVPLNGADPTQHARRVIEHHRHSTLKNGGKVIEERDVTVDRVAGRQIQLEFPVRDVVWQMLVVSFVRHDREYKLTFLGQKEFFEAAKPHVTRMIESMRWVESKAP